MNATAPMVRRRCLCGHKLRKPQPTTWCAAFWDCGGA